MPKFKPYNQSQMQLLPPDLSSLIKPDHIARLINQVIDDMDLSFIENTYSTNGCRAYNPKMLFKILVYGYTIGLRSSRKLADRLREDIVFMWLAGRQTPDFRTIADFRKNKLNDIKKAFTEVLLLCQQLGMVRIGKIYIDGTKIKASANSNRIQYRKTLNKRKTIIEEQINNILEEAKAIDDEEDRLYGNKTEHSGIDIREVQKELAKLKKRKQTLTKKKEKLEVKRKEIKAKLRKMRKDRNSYAITDKDATLMLMKEKYIAPGYNVQLATEHQVILAYNVCSDRTDFKQLKPMVKEVEENTKQKPKIVITDAGYGAKSNYRFLKNKGITAFIPYGNFNKEITQRNKGIYALPKNVDVELERYKFKQRLRLLSAEGKELMKRRKNDIEPTIGDIKRNMNFREFYLRGRLKCLIEIGLVSIGHNLKKIKKWIEKLAKQGSSNQKGQELSLIPGFYTNLAA